MVCEDDGFDDHRERNLQSGSGLLSSHRWAVGGVNSVVHAGTVKIALDVLRHDDHCLAGDGDVAVFQYDSATSYSHVERSA